MDNERRARLLGLIKEAMDKEAGLPGEIARKLGGKKAVKKALKRKGGLFGNPGMEDLTAKETERLFAWRAGQDTARLTSKARKQATRQGVDLSKVDLSKHPTRQRTTAARDAASARIRAQHGKESKAEYRYLKALEKKNKKWSPA